MAMLSLILACGVTGSTLLRVLPLADKTGAAIVLVVASFVITAYTVPRVTACWLGRPLDKIMD